MHTCLTSSQLSCQWNPFNGFYLECFHDLFHLECCALTRSPGGWALRRFPTTWTFYREESNSWLCLTNLICSSEMTPRWISSVGWLWNTLLTWWNTGLKAGSVNTWGLLLNTCLTLAASVQLDNKFVGRGKISTTKLENPLCRQPQLQEVTLYNLGKVFQIWSDQKVNSDLASLKLLFFLKCRTAQIPKEVFNIRT